MPHAVPRLGSDETDVLAGGGELGARMRAIDWSRTPLGPVASWPQSLKTCVRIVLTSRQPMFVWWGDQLVNLYNDAYRSILGGKHPTALGQPASIVWREIWDQVGPRAAAAMSGNEGTYDEALLLIMERNGYEEETYYTFSYSPVPNDQGGTGGILCANTDDTQRILGERQLALLREQATRTLHVRTVDEACAQAALAFDSNPSDMPFALFYLTEPDRRTMTLAAATRIAPGHVAAPAQVRPGDPSPWPLAQVLARRTPQLVELDASFGELPRGAWPRPPSRAVAIPVLPSGDVRGAGVLVVGLNPYRLYDVTYDGFLGFVANQLAASLASAQAAEDEKKRVEALAEIDRAKTTFFSNVSHEFRTPLTLMIGPIEDALATPDGALAGANLEAAHRNAQRLLKLVNALLDFSRIEAGRVHATYEATDLASYTAELASVFRSAMERAGLRFVVDTPPLAVPVHVDRDMWEKIVLNLLSNAFKFTFEGEIAVRLRRDPERARVVLTVSDTGTGVPAAELPHLFERFHRVRGARARTHEGSGIGLALIHELVKLHGGDIHVESEVGRGTTFAIALPLGTAHLPPDKIASAVSALPRARTGPASFVEEALRWLPSHDEHGEQRRRSDRRIAAAPLATPSASTLETTRRRVVLADDNADMREYVARLLGAQWDVEAVADGAAALEAARREKPALVVSDVMMPNLDGFGLVREMRADAATRTVPVILLSARAGEEATTEGLESGANDYLVKPFSARELLARVSAQIAIADVREEAERAKEAQRRIIETVFNEAPSPIAVVRGPELVIEFANPACAAAWQRRAASEVMGKPLLEALPELRGQGFDGLLLDVIATGEVHHGDEMPARLRRPDGAEVTTFFNFVYVPSTGPSGARDGVSLFAYDVTSQVRARTSAEVGSRIGRVLVAPQRLEEQLRLCCEAILQLGVRSASVWVHDPVQNVLERTGSAGDDARVHGVDSRAAMRGTELGEVLTAGEPTFTEWTSPGGEASPVLHVARLPLSAGERDFGVLALTSDAPFSAESRVTLSATADQIALAIDRDAGERFRELFIGMLGHDLRNPLNAVLMAAVLLSTNADDKQRRVLARIESSARRMERMVHQVLDFTRARSGGGIPLTRERGDLGAVCEQVIEELRTAHSDGAIAWSVEGDTSGSWDSDRMAQMVSNLVGNALAYGAKGRAVEVTLVGRSDTAVLTVRNEGAPIPPQLLATLFDPFRRATQAKTASTQGLGLGLFISEQIVVAHGGSIRVESTAESGTIVTVKLPKESAAP